MISDQETVTMLRDRLAGTPPAPLREAGPVEVHSLVSHEHTPLYLFAMKSLAYYWPDVVAVVHDDGTLTEPDADTLRQHLPGVRVIARAEADAAIADLLAPYPLLASVRRGNVRILQLVDYFLLSQADVVVGMDSDLLFLSYPGEVIRWSADPGDGPVFRYSPEEGWEPQGVHWIPEALPSVPYVPRMCCGFTCARRERFFDPGYVEELMARTPPEIRHYPRYVTQMFYSLLGGRPGVGAHTLGEPYRSGRWEWLPVIEDRVLCHYFASHERDTTDESLLGEADLFATVLDRLEGRGPAHDTTGISTR